MLPAPERPRTVLRVRTRRALLAAALVAAFAVTGCGRSPATGSPAPAHPGASAGASAPNGSAEPTGPAPAVPAALVGRDLERLPTSEKVVALTFDAGANADGVPSILATLAREHITETFFLTGVFVTTYPDAARQTAAAGHRIGNHSNTHPAFAGLALPLIDHEVLTGAQSIQRVTG